jgi:hypothetical protein
MFGQVFYWTHLLYIPFWVLLILHGPNFWYWFIGPGVLFLIEGTGRFRLRVTGKGRTFISSALLLPSRVTHLVIRKPENFHFNPGDYVYVKIPAITSSEWHPFTISSAPELQGKILSNAAAIFDLLMTIIQITTINYNYFKLLIELFVENRFYMATYSMCWWLDQ